MYNDLSYIVDSFGDSDSYAINVDVLSNFSLATAMTNDLELNDSERDCDPSYKYFNCTREKYLETFRGPQMLPLSIVLPVSDEVVVL